MIGQTVSPQHLHRLRHRRVDCSRAAPTLHRADPAGDREQALGVLDGCANLPLSVSPDGRSVLYPQVVSEGSDILLIENFRRALGPEGLSPAGAATGAPRGAGVDRKRPLSFSQAPSAPAAANGLT
jgi:hypothetical protein